MIDRRNLLGRSISGNRGCIGTESLGRIQSIAQELERIKELVNQIEARGNQNINKSDLDEIEDRLNILEFELFYDSLN